jgi:hypothetical protein
MKSTLLRLAIKQLIPLSIGLLALSVPVSAEAPDDDEPAAASFPQVDQKLKKLKKRIKALETEVGELQALNLPIDVDVNCASGSIGNVLATHASGLGLLTIRVTGTCNEQVVITRSNVLLEGQAAAVVQIPTGNYGISVTNAARNVTVANVTIIGGTGSVAVNKGAHALFTNVIAEQSNLGMVAADNGVLDITASTMRNNTYGAYSTRSAVIHISNSVIENNSTGVLAIKGGHINLSSMLPDGTITAAPVIVRNNTNGGLARTGSGIEITDVRIENNTIGLIADSLSSLHLFNSLNNTGNFVTGNRSVGLLLQKNTAIAFTDADNTISGNGIGVLCQGNPSYIVSPVGPGNVTGNPGGNIVGCTP